MNNTWHLWRDEDREPELNMAIDDCLLRERETDPKTVLRFYGWSRPAHTIGYFQPIRSAGAESTVIRRPSGGGVVDHRNDFTFTLVFPESSPLFQCDRFESYRLINAAIRNALEALGVESFLFGGDVPKDFDRAFLVCFQQPAKFDVVNRLGKLCGGAQRRKRHGMLHQGSILLDQLQSVPKSTIADALVEAFIDAFSITMEPYKPSAGLLEHAKTLAHDRYSSDSWNNRK